MAIGDHSQMNPAPPAFGSYTYLKELQSPNSLTLYIKSVQRSAQSIALGRHKTINAIVTDSASASLKTSVNEDSIREISLSDGYVGKSAIEYGGTEVIEMDPINGEIDRSIIGTNIDLKNRYTVTPYGDFFLTSEGKISYDHSSRKRNTTVSEPAKNSFLTSVSLQVGPSYSSPLFASQCIFRDYPGYPEICSAVSELAKTEFETAHRAEAALTAKILAAAEANDESKFFSRKLGNVARYYPTSY